MISLNSFLDILREYKKTGNNEIFSKYSSLFGVYSERDNNRFMIRYKFTGGIILPSELMGIAEVLRDLEYKTIHFTTRQDIQFHHLTIDELESVMIKCNERGLISLASGGPTTRNIQISPLAGVDINEDYNVTEYVLEASKYILNEDPSYTLPKKYKVSISNNFNDTVNATVSDLGFIATVKNNIKGFKVYGGGGMGIMPSPGIELCEFDSSENITYHILAMRNIFDQYGERKIKAKARVRHILQRLSEDEFIRIYTSEVKRLKKEKDLVISIKGEEKIYESKPLLSLREYPLIKFAKYRNIITKQKQKGYYSLYVHPYLGDMDINHLTKIINTIEKLNYSITLRLTNTQGFYIRDIKEQDVEKMINAIEYNPQRVFTSVSCTGSSTCKKGILHSKEMLSYLLENLKKEKHSIINNIPKIQISGCPNSCGQHQIGSLGFCGRIRRKKLGAMPYYGVFINGKLSENTSLAYEIGELPGRKILEFLKEVGNLKYQSKVRSFEAFFKEKEEDIKNIINRLSNIDEDDEGLYSDFNNSVNNF
ncbi:MAG: nitrite/sulfite reductase [Clostridium sp.]